MEISWGYIFHAPQADPAKDRFVLDRAGCKATLVAVPDQDTAVRVAKEMVQSGIKSIEVCGMFGVTGAARIFEALEGRAAVGGVTFGSESIAKVMEAFFPPR
jgi:hypothetical protein